MEAEKNLTGKIILSVVSGGLLVVVIYVYNLLVLKPNRLRSKLEKQGIRGPSPSFLLGNIPEMKRIQLQSTAKTAPKDHHHDGVALAHDWLPTVFPCFEQWRNEYGPIFVYSTGNIQQLYITDPEMVKEVSLCISLDLGKPSYLSKDRGAILGQGIFSSSGPIWAHQRKIIAPELYFHKVKVYLRSMDPLLHCKVAMLTQQEIQGMVNLMVGSTISTIKSWENRVDSKGGTMDINVYEDLKSLSADIISRACFGSSYSQGKEIFLKLKSLQRIMSKQNIFVGVPGSSYLPSKNNREIWRLEKEMNSMILKVVKQRIEATHEKDLLQMILEGAKSYGANESLSSDITCDKFIIDNCKTIYFAGHETTAVSASWSLQLLAAHPAWQARVRAEVLEICGDSLPDADMLQNMKTLTMVIQETLRLYPATALVSREAIQDMKFRDILLPKGINVRIPVPTLHLNPDLWGADAHQFNPERFANGILGACKIPQAYLPFGMGTRTCVGQHLAMVELKVVLSLLLSKFCFSLSPTYRHSLVYNLVIEPKHGINLLVKRVEFEKL